MRQYFSHGQSHTRTDVLADWLEKREPFKNSTKTFRGEPNPKVIDLGRLAWEREDADKLTDAYKAGLLDYIVYSYATPIIWHVKGVGWVDPGHSYSRTTTAKHYGPTRTAIAYLEDDK